MTCHYRLIKLILFDVAIATFNNLFNMAALKERLNKRTWKSKAKPFDLSINVYLIYLCEMTRTK